MRIALENRSDQHVVMHYTTHDGRPGVCQIEARGERAVPVPGRAAIPHILDHLARFGVVAAEGADRFDAARGPHVPPWKGVVYRVEGGA